jgi:hypothetical protein
VTRLQGERPFLADGEVSGDQAAHVAAERRHPVTIALHRAAPLLPLTDTLRAMFGTSTEIPGLAPDLVVTDPVGWVPTTALAGDHLDLLLESAGHRWHAQPHAAAALAWKAYTYWLALPAVLGWASARRVPLLTGPDVLMHFRDRRPLLTLGLRADIPIAVLPGDPIALAGLPQVRVVQDEEALLAEFRRSLLDEHLTPLLNALHDRVRLGKRTLLGSLASGVAYGILRSADAVPGSSADNVSRLLTALGVEDLVELAPDATGRLDVHRKTCCLAFTLPQPKVCKGCCIK